MSQTLSPSLARCYGLARVARVWKISRASVYRSLKETPPNTSARRPGPVGACSDAELADHIRQHIAASRLHGEGYRKLWARLRFAGVRASPRRVRRVMRANGLLAPHRVGRTEAKPHDGTIITDKVNEMWGTDMTQTITIREGRANVFVAVEHSNSEVVGIHASRSANRFEALEPVRQGVHRCFGAIAPGVARGLKLRHDHVSNYMSVDFHYEIECLVIESSPSLVKIFPTERSCSATPKRRCSSSRRSTRRQRTTPCTAGSGPASTSSANSACCRTVSFDPGPGDLRLRSPASPAAL